MSHVFLPAFKVKGGLLLPSHLPAPNPCLCRRQLPCTAASGLLGEIAPIEAELLPELAALLRSPELDAKLRAAYPSFEAGSVDATTMVLRHLIFEAIRGMQLGVSAAFGCVHQVRGCWP